MMMMSPYDLKFDTKINVDHSDLNFLLQWFWFDIFKSI